MTIFRRELLIDRGPERLVVWRDSDRHEGLEVFTVDREGGIKTVPNMSDREVSWLIQQLREYTGELPMPVTVA